MYKNNLKSKEVIEDSKKIELSELNKFIVLMRGSNIKVLTILLNWYYVGKPTGDIGLTIDINNNCLVLMYCLGGKPYYFTVSLVKKFTYNGGYKYFMACPCCGKLIRTLYKAPSKDCFQCRTCSNLIYHDQKYRDKTYDKWFENLLNFKL